MLINGEKWACEACVRGHRVSNCQHNDRPLQHINKKGRPVSQCQHCRSMRKSRSAHVKCDCGEKTSKCIHLRTPQEGHRDTCCCNHGGRCTCAHKTEQNQLDTVPEAESDRETSPCSSKPASRNRRRANTIQADGALTFDENGHHKPIHKGAKASQKCGPYQLNRVHSVHSTSSLSNRSVENLMHKNGADPRKRGPAAGRTAHSKSETASPQMCNSPSSFAQLNPGLPPLDLSSIDYPSYVQNFENFGNGPTDEPPMFSAGLRSASSIDWSHYDGLPSFGASSFGRGNTLSGGFDFGSDQAALTNTTSNSGDVSEAEDFTSTGNDDGFRLSTNSSFIMSQAQASMLASPDVNTLTIDDFLKQQQHSKFLPTNTLDDTFPNPAYSLAEDALWASNYDGVAAMPESPVDSGVTYWDHQ
ncbi:uncharacterized protein MKZ38_003819 [Zalerion maritima]|uniref:Copper-fist domain-containing protein n=1 Tax=Zalerion maritima TaxID=339359 RepID=A0AAD5RTQ6_9PEZI|nr:uncharacterized protein MKZ38_003819 [Zalerion maritima]